MTQAEAAEHFVSDQMNRGRTTLSGSGSTLPNTRNIRRWLRDVIERYDIDSILDAPCGDHRWMADVPFSGRYRGVDCVEWNLEAARYRAPGRRFVSVDLLNEQHDPHDLILSRDFFVHLSFDNAARVLNSFRNSGSDYLAVTHFPEVTANTDIESEWGWRPLNMTLEPFNLPAPIETCAENEGQGKTLALFRL